MKEPYRMKTIFVGFLLKLNLKFLVAGYLYIPE